MKKHLLYLLITLFSIQISYAQCDNVTSPGSIAADQIVCADNPDPAPILNVELPSGGSGDLEFLWISTTQSPSSSTTSWFPIPGSTEDSYDPDPISQTTYFRRCSRRAGCSEYIGESNIIVVVYADECIDNCDLFKITVDALTPADCDADNGTLSLSIVAGTFPLSYDLNGEILDELPETFAAGSYDLTITDAEGCTDAVSFTIGGTENTIAVVGDTVNPICQAPNGSITLSISGGSGNYTALWNDGSTDTNRTGLLDGIYTVIISDESSCSNEKSFVLTMMDNDLAVSLEATNASCNNSDGSAEVIITGGMFPYLIKLDGTPVTEITNLPPGTYLVTVTDINGCAVDNELTIEESESDIIISGTTTNPVCNMNSGTINLLIEGGTGTVSILWEDGSINLERTDLGAGVYTVTATDENGCITTASFTLELDLSDLNLDLSLTDVSCNGGNDGAAIPEITGGTAPYILTLDGTEVTEITGLAAGEYTAKVVDAMGCTVSVPFSIAQASLLTVDAILQNPSCGAENGSIELIVAGGTGIYTIIWDDNLSNDLIRNDLAAGTYSLTVKDENNCITTTQFILTGEDSGLATELTINNVSCNGEADGSVEVVINNGTPPYFFTLNGSVVLDLNNLSTGAYVLETTDITGCSVIEEFTISEPSAIEITSIIIQPTCAVSNGSVGLNITGGTPDDNGDYTITWSEGDGTNLAAGDYTVTVMDTNGCLAAAAFTLIGSDADLNAIILTTPISCHDSENGTAEITVTGGTAPYSYILNGESLTDLPLFYSAGEYALTIIDVNGCSIDKDFNIGSQEAITLSATVNPTSCATAGSIDIAVTGGFAPYTYLWSNGETSQNLNNIPAGDYFVTVTDANDCTSSNTEAYTVINEGGDTFTVSVSTTAVSCFGGMNGTASVSIDGGTEPYTYILNGSQVDDLSTEFAAGDYILMVQDANGCSNEATFTITQADAALSFSGLVQNASCGNDVGAIELTVAGGTAPYTYLWSNNTETQNLSNAPLGNNTVTITDANGCTVNNADAPFVISQVADVALTSVVTPTSCGEENGNIAIVISQGIPPYQIVWNDGLTDVVLRSDLAGGEYSVTVTDASACSISEEFSIETSIPFTVDIIPTSASCNGTNDGEISMSFAGGIPPFVYILNGEALDDLPSTLPTDDYQLQVFDGLGCSDLVEFSIGEPDEIVYLAEQTDAVCPGDFVTVEFATVQGGSGEYTYLWSDDVTTLNRDDLTSGTYFLTITDTNGCTAVSEPFVVNVPSEIIITADDGSIQNISCIGEEDGMITVSVTGGTAPYTYFWSNGATTPTIENLAPGEYLLQLTDANGCGTMFFADFSDPTELTATSLVTDATCMMADGIASIWPMGGSQPYHFLWDNGSMEAEESNLAPGSYKVTVSDNNGCETTLDVEVGELDCLQSDTGEQFSFVMNEVTADLTNNSVEIHWMTEAEAIESFFIIQHSQDGETFNDVSGLLAGAGATQTQNEYYNTCLDMALGTHFFRIRYVDAYGNLISSEIMSTELIPDNKTEFSVFPNPTIDEFRISFLLPLDAPAQVQIVNAQAGILENITAPTGTLHQNIDLRKYNPGVYFVIVEKEGLRRLTKRIVKM